jgi:hypothetical protein
MGHHAAQPIGTCIRRVSIASRRGDTFVVCLAPSAGCMVTSWDEGHRQRISGSDHLVLRLSDRWADLRRGWGTGGWLGAPGRCRWRVHRISRRIAARADPAKGDGRCNHRRVRRRAARTHVELVRNGHAVARSRASHPCGRHRVRARWVDRVRAGLWPQLVSARRRRRSARPVRARCRVDRRAVLLPGGSIEPSVKPDC